VTGPANGRDDGAATGWRGTLRRMHSVEGARNGENNGRDRFSMGELAVVCSHYDLGVIESVHEFPRGSRRAPKVLLRTSRGPMLLKRRAPGRDDPHRVAFSHELQLHLHAAGFPAPEIIGTRAANNTLLQAGGHVYELFRYVPGEDYDRSEESTADAGALLARLHRLLGGFAPTFPPPSGSFHARPAVVDALRHGGRLPTDPPARSALRQLRHHYEAAAQAVDRAGYGSWPVQVVHGDWHPGNMVFRSRRVAAVVDFDSACVAPTQADAAAGALQFSITRGRGRPGQWPAELDLGRLGAFYRGCREERGRPPDHPEVIPDLMVEVLIAETIAPIAATGTFGGLDAGEFLSMALRKADWLRSNAGEVARAASGERQGG